MFSGSVTLNTVGSSIQVQLPFTPSAIGVTTASTDPDHTNGRLGAGFINSDLSQWSAAECSNGNETDVDFNAGILVIDSSGNPVVRAIATNINPSTSVLTLNVTHAATMPVFLTLYP